MLPAPAPLVNSDDPRSLLPSVSEGGENAADSPLTITQYDQLILITELLLVELRKSAEATSLDIKRMEQTRVDQARARNALLPIQALPDELLLAIWEHVVYESALKGADGVWILAQVSKAWADLVGGSSDLWCNISSQFSPQRTRQALQKSLERPLHVFLGTEHDVGECFDTVLPHCHRWRELRLAVGLPEITNTLQLVSLPILEHLELRPRPGLGTHAEPPKLDSCPSLRTLILHSVPLNWPSPSVPAGIRSLAICNVRHGPTFPQLLTLLSSTSLLEELRLEGVYLASDSRPPIEKEKSLQMPHLQNIRMVNLTREATSSLLSLIRTNQCRSLVATPLNLFTLPDYMRNLRNLLAPIASSTQEIFLDIGGSDFAFAVVSSNKAPEPFVVPPATDRSGFVLGFRPSDPIRETEYLVSFVAYTPTPLSLSLDLRRPATHAAIVDGLDWDQLPSLRQLEIKSRFPLDPIFRSLSMPRGHRRSPRWPCPRLSILKLPGMEFLPNGFIPFLLDRWGPPEHDGLKIDKSRPTRLTLCHAPKKAMAWHPCSRLMPHYAEVWEESATVPPEDEPSTEEEGKETG